MLNHRVNIFGVLLLAGLAIGCGKSSSSPEPPPPAPGLFFYKKSSINSTSVVSTAHNINVRPLIRFSFSAPVDRAGIAAAVKIRSAAGVEPAYGVSYENSDSTIVLQPSGSLNYLEKYTVDVASTLRSSQGRNLQAPTSVVFVTTIDSTRKFPSISDNELLTKIQQQTFKFFWDFGHPVSGLARERSNGDDNIVTSGGSGFGMMAILVGIERGFITRAEGLTRMQTIVSFLKNTADKFQGAFPHWLNGSTGKVVPFASDDDGADLVETAYAVQGLLCARQYFDGAGTAETSLRSDINAIWNGVDWEYFRKADEDVLYWHWSPLGFIKNVQIKGWNECLITYVLAAASTTHTIPKTVYDNGWASNGGMKNGNSYYGYQLPLGPAQGGPLFFAHYSFLGINPQGLSDAYANYNTQNTNHTLINRAYCLANPKGYFGYSDSVWGITASDIQNGYKASSPTDDAGYIAPTAALSSFPYTPTESMAALKFFYYTLGDKIWKEYGFVDAFNLHTPWFANSFLAIDQGPIIVMIENYRSKLLWNLFTSCPEVKDGMQALGFTAPYL